MLNNLDILSKINVKLLDLQETCSSFVAKFADILADYQDIALINFNSEQPEAEIPIQHYTKVKAFLHAFDGITLPFPEGWMVSVVETDNSVGDFEIYTYTDASHNDRTIAELIVDHSGTPSTFTLRFLGWATASDSADLNNFVYPAIYLADTQSISSVVTDAIALAYKGELNASNLMAIVQSQGVGLTGAVISAYNYITSLVSGSEAVYQATGLIEAIKQIYGSAEVDNITGNDVTNVINFHTTEYSVSTSVCLPVSSIITAATTLVSTIVSFFSPIFGVIAAAVSAAFSGLLAYLDDAYGNTWHFSAEAQTVNNEAFTTPIASYSFDMRTDTSVPQTLKDFVNKYGYTKAENMFYTIFAWVNDDNVNFINVEVFPNVNVDFRRWSTASEEQAFTNMKNSVTYNEGTYSTITCVAPSLEKENLLRWCDNDFSPADITKVQYPDDLYRSKTDYISRWCTYSYIYQLWWTCYRIMYLKYGSTVSQSLYSYTTDLDLIFWDPAFLHQGIWNTEEDRALYLIQTFMSYFNAQFQDQDYKPGWMFMDKWSDYTTGMINTVYTAIKTLQSTNPILYSKGWIADMFEMFPSFVGIVDFTSRNRILGLTNAWSYTPCIAYTDKMLACPPANRYSINTRLIVTGATLGLIAATAFAIGLQVRKFVQYKATEKVKEIDKLNQNYINSGSFDDYSEYRSAVLKYNWSYGKLTGTRYDPMLASFISSKVTSALAATATAVPSILSNSDGSLGINVDLTPVTRLIK